MIGVKQEFYETLRSDYIKKGNRSFLYRYMEQEKITLLSLREKEIVTGKRGDVYLQIKMYERAFQSKVLSKTEFLKSLLQMLLKGDKLRLDKESRQMIFCIALKIEGERFFEQCKRDVDKYENVINSLSKAKDALLEWENTITEDCLEKITKELLECTLTVDIHTFLYDAGFPVNANGKIGKARKKDRNLDMLTAYCMENDISFNKGNGQMKNLSDEQIAQYEKLYHSLQTSNNTDVIIPVQIDALTGAGVYIVGKNNISPRSAVYKKIKGNCCYVCFLVDGLHVENYNGISSFSWLISDHENRLCNLPDLNEALKWNLYCKAESLNDLQERNGKAPVGCPEDFLVFFENDTKDELYISEEELEEVKKMFS